MCWGNYCDSLLAFAIIGHINYTIALIVESNEMTIACNPQDAYQLNTWLVIGVCICTCVYFTPTLIERNEMFDCILHQHL